MWYGFSGVEKEILEIFFNLHHKTLEKLFKSYTNKYGEPAGKYARKTYYSWQKGYVSPSGKTLFRLLDILPPLLKFEQKILLLKKIVEKNRKPISARSRENYRLKVDIDNLEEKILPLVATILKKGQSVNIPAYLEKSLTWLSNNDMKAAEAILKQVEEEEKRVIFFQVRKELLNLQNLFLTLPDNREISHTISLAHGDIKLNLERIKMKEKDNLSVVPTSKQNSLFRPTADDLFESAFENLNKQQVQKVSEMATEEALKIAAKKKTFELQSENAKRDVNQFVENVNMIDKSSGIGDYKMSGTFDSATGNTKIEVSRQRNATAIVVTVVIGLIILIFLLAKFLR